MKITTVPLPELTIARFDKMRRVIDLNPPYQREGGIWDEDTQARLIDSILNGLDVPKLYFEKAQSRRQTLEGLSYRYSVIDGKQRLEAIIKFLDGNLTLPADFHFFEDEGVRAANMNVAQVSESYPQLFRRFREFELPVVIVSTDSGDLIEEMFQRLNASSALNAAERRNAISGATKESANALAKHPLLIECSPIKSARFKYRELGAKFLAIEHQFATKGKLLDTKADTLLQLFRATRGQDPEITQVQMEGYEERAHEVLDRMRSVFIDSDYLLRSIGTVVVYYLVFRTADDEDCPSREKLDQFEEARKIAAQLPENGLETARTAVIRVREYNSLVQSTNDGAALSRRAEILSEFLYSSAGSDAPFTL